MFSSTILLDNYEQLESRYIEGQLSLVISHVNSQVSSLEILVGDWGEWDDMYDFVNGKDPDFIYKNIANTTFTGMFLNFIVITDKDSNILFGSGYDLFSDSPVPL